MANLKKYSDFKQEIILFEGIDDIHPVSIILPDPPNKNTIANYNRPASSQKWEKIPLPKDFSRFSRMDKEDIHKLLRPDEHKYIVGEYKNIENGKWFYNNGDLTYITGNHYFYLNYWVPDFGKPNYKQTDRNVFLHWEKIVKDEGCHGLVEMTRRRQGKCFGLNTPIRMYDGSVKMVQDIKDGDFVMGDDSEKRIVSGITSGREEMFEIIPHKGDSFLCNKSHILSLYYNKQCGNLKRGWKKQSIINISVGDYLNLEDHEKSHLVLFRAGWGDNFKENKHYIPPYLLGVYLGDGNKYDGGITTVDYEIVDELNKFCDRNNLNLHNYKLSYRLLRKETDGGKSLSICKEGNILFFKTIKELNDFFGWGHDSRRHLRSWFKEKYNPKYLYLDEKNPYRKGLAKIGVLFNKNIPKEYLIDSEKNRLELLAGLIDTDGYLQSEKRKPTPSYSYEIIQKNKNIATGIVELSRSLGFYTSINIKKSTLKRKNKEDYSCNVYRIKIHGSIDRIPVRIKRKKINHVYKPRVNSLNTGFEVRPVGMGDYYGFSVDKNNLFLLADGTVVHNSARAGCIAYYRTFSHKNRYCGIQSKTDDDASEFFQKTIALPWKKLPFFFQPHYDNTNNPRHELRFYTPTKRGKESQLELGNEDALESWIQVRASGETAFDGAKLHTSIEDEIGKTVVANVSKRWDIKKFCLEVDGEIIGKALMTTTVEEMEKMGGKFFKDIWDASDIGSKLYKDTGRTESGLHRHFTPAYEGYLVDDYGNSKVEESKKDLISKREALRSKSAALTSLKRKMPFTIKEAFRSAGKECPFNVEIIDSRLEFFTFDNPYVSYGNFRWKDNQKDTTVIFEKTNKEHAKFIVSYLFENPIEANKIIYRSSERFPGNTTFGIAGADPFKYNETIGSKKSKGSGVVFMNHNILVDPEDKDVSEWKTNRFICSYNNRTSDKREYGEDMIMMCVYYGIQMFPEVNVDFVWDYFLERGYGGYLFYQRNSHHRISKTPGANTNDKTKDAIFAEFESYINLHGSRDVHPEILEAAREVDFMNLGPSDLFVASGYALLGAKKSFKLRPDTKKISGKLFHTYSV